MPLRKIWKLHSLKGNFKSSNIFKCIKFIVRNLFSSRENTLDEDGSEGNPIFEDFGKTALIKS